MAIGERKMGDAMSIPKQIIDHLAFLWDNLKPEVKASFHDSFDEFVTVQTEPRPGENPELMDAYKKRTRK